MVVVGRIQWDRLDRASYSDILYNLADVSFNMYFNNFPRSMYEDMTQFMVLRMLEVMNKYGFNTMKSLRNYFFKLGVNAGRIYLYYNRASMEWLDIDEIFSAGSEDDQSNLLDTLSSEVIYNICLEFEKYGDRTQDIIRFLVFKGANVDNWYKKFVDPKARYELVVDEEVCNDEVFNMLKGMVMWEYKMSSLM